MKLAVFTDEISQELEVAVSMAVRHQLEGLELRSIWKKPVQHLNEAEVDRIRGAMEEHGLALAAVASPVFKCELEDAAAHREHLESLRSCIKIARVLGTNIIRVFTFWKHGPSAPVWEKVKKQFRPAIPIAEGEGMILAVENEHSTYCATAKETGQFVEEMGSEAVRIVWDPCNEIHTEEGEKPYPDAYRRVATKLVHLHVKDGIRDAKTGNARVTLVGEGEVDWKGQFVELLRANYDGYASLETHWRPQALPEDALNRPGGEGFSEAGEYATELCLEKMLEILGEARREVG